MSNDRRRHPLQPHNVPVELYHNPGRYLLNVRVASVWLHLHSVALVSVLQESLLWLFQSRLPLPADPRIEFNTFATVFFPKMSGPSFVWPNSLTKSVLSLCCRTCTSSPRDFAPYNAVMNKSAMDDIPLCNLDIERSRQFNLEHSLAQIISSLVTER